MTRGPWRLSSVDVRGWAGMAVATAIACAAGPVLAAPQSTAPEARTHVVIGCLSLGTPTADVGGTATADPVFAIADRRSDPPSTYRVRGDRTLLELHVGHTVELRGTMAPAPAASAGKGEPASPTFTVDTLVWISTRCLD